MPRMMRSETEDDEALTMESAAARDGVLDRRLQDITSLLSLDAPTGRSSHSLVRCAHAAHRQSIRQLLVKLRWPLRPRLQLLRLTLPHYFGESAHRRRSLGEAVDMPAGRHVVFQLGRASTTHITRWRGDLSPSNSLLKSRIRPPISELMLGFQGDYAELVTVMQKRCAAAA